MTTGELIQVIPMGLLVLVTGIYAWRTFAISKAAEKQATEIREQRYSESLPLLAPDITRDWDTQGFEPNEVPHVYLQTGIGMKITWHNVDKGVAINSRFSLYTAPLDSSPGKALFLPPLTSESLGTGDHTKINYHEARKEQVFDFPQGYHPRLEAEYQDLYERNATTVQEFRIDEQNNRAFLGELYFTVNGRRLGEETARYD